MIDRRGQTSVARAVACLLLTAGAHFGCGGSSNPGGPGNGGTLPPPPPPVQTNAVSVLDSRFQPEQAAIGAGITVTWTWGGALQHNVTFEDGQGSSTTKMSGTHDRAFPGTGTFRYRCTIHSTSFTSGMVGAIVVQ
jgi:hypothetical protein